jgi:hypothetical protein
VLLLVVSAQEASKVSGSNDGIISSGSGDLLLLLVDLRGVALGSGDPSSGEYSRLSSSPSTTQDPSSCDFGIPEGIALHQILSRVISFEAKDGWRASICLLQFGWKWDRNTTDGKRTVGAKIMALRIQ